MRTPVSSIDDIEQRLPELMLRDARTLRRRIDAARRTRDPRRRSLLVERLTADLDAAERRVSERRAAAPVPSYPAALPVSEHRAAILRTISDNQVVIVAGETGSGKTTQLPKICLELGRGVRGLIGHTQPRRIAARTVAERIAEELDTPLGEAVGYKVRFTDQVGHGTFVKLMTDGILLAELQNDRMLEQYDTLIIDEAHERSLNIDFILGYVKQLLPRRPDLKVVITSATIDPVRFSRHFDDAPIVEVSGRTYPVEVRYRPLVDPDAEDRPERDQIEGIVDAVDELRLDGPGDVLVFLSGEREIRDTADVLRRRRLPDTEILPLYARLSAAEQHRVFKPHAVRRIVLATNVAETSLTVPGIRYVVDPGTARISRYSHRLKVQRLPIEPVSQASANQRKGRCGRTSDGVCIRLYSEEDFAARPEFTDPEILRTNLASVILQMTALGLGDIAAFPFVDPPDRRHVKDGLQLLEELGAIDPSEKDPAKRLTPLGRRLAQLPIDPRLGRMVLEAERNGCVHEVLVITAALSIQDPRERPADRQQAADDRHRRFVDEKSDFLSYLNLWDYLQERQRALSSNQFRKLCREEFLHYLRVREWQDLYAQLRQAVKGLGIRVVAAAASAEGPAGSDNIHVSLLAGLLSHIGLKDAEKSEYAGARGARFAVWPGSALFKKPPNWVMAGELVETSRLWARDVARIEPEWAENLAQHLVKRTYSEPHWERRRSAVVAYEKVTLYGVPIVARRKVDYGRIDPVLSRELFIRHALVEGDWDTRHEFFHENRELVADVEALEDRIRRRDILVDDETLFDFYDERIGADVVSGRHFDSWWKKVRRSRPDLLTFPRELLVLESASGVDETDYPDSWRFGELTLPLSYQFEPGSAADGVTVQVPLAVLNQLSAGAFEWQVPGLREELVTALIRSLPKQLRRNFVPAPNYAQAVSARLVPSDVPLREALGKELRRLTGVEVPVEAWQLDRVPDHLRVTFRVIDESSRTVAEGKNLDDLKRRLRPAIRAAFSAAADGIERTGLRGWDFGTLPRTFERKRAGHRVLGYPALVDEGGSVAIRVLETEAEQQRAMWQGTRRLLLLEIPSPVRAVQSRLSNEAKLALLRNPHGGVVPLFDDCLSCAVDGLIAEHGGPAWDGESYAKLRDRVRAALPAALTQIVAVVQQILTAAGDVDARLRNAPAPVLAPAVDDVRNQLAGLIHPGFVAATGTKRLPHLVRYLRAAERRLERVADDPVRDRQRMAQVEQVTDAYEQRLGELPQGSAAWSALREVRWMIEEFRVSLFAQALGTAYPVSAKRILRAIDEADS